MDAEDELAQRRLCRRRSPQCTLPASKAISISESAWTPPKCLLTPKGPASQCHEGRDLPLSRSTGGKLAHVLLGDEAFIGERVAGSIPPVFLPDLSASTIACMARRPSSPGAPNRSPNQLPSANAGERRSRTAEADQL